PQRKTLSGTRAGCAEGPGGSYAGLRRGRACSGNDASGRRGRRDGSRVISLQLKSRSRAKRPAIFFSVPLCLCGELWFLLATGYWQLTYSLLIPCFCALTLQKPAIHAAFHTCQKKFPVIFPVIAQFASRSDEM